MKQAHPDAVKKPSPKRGRKPAPKPEPKTPAPPTEVFCTHCDKGFPDPTSLDFHIQETHAVSIEAINKINETLKYESFIEDF